MFISSQLTPEHKYFIISLITIGYSLTEFAVMGGYNFAMMDIAPDYFGILQGINKTISLAPGFIIPLIISALTPHVIMFFILSNLSKDSNLSNCIFKLFREQKKNGKVFLFCLVRYMLLRV